MLKYQDCPIRQSIKWLWTDTVTEVFLIGTQFVAQIMVFSQYQFIIITFKAAFSFKTSNELQSNLSRLDVGDVGRAYLVIRCIDSPLVNQHFLTFFM